MARVTLASLQGKTREFLDEAEPDNSGLGDHEVARRMAVRNETIRRNINQIISQLNDVLTQPLKRRPPVSASAGSQEILVAQKKLDIEKSANDKLREDINEKYNPERIEEWRAELADIKAQERKLIAENTTLKLNIRRVGAQFQVTEKDAYERKLAALQSDLNACKEKLTLYVARHNSEEKSAAKVLDHTTQLEQKVKQLEDEVNRARQDAGLGPREDGADELTNTLKQLQATIRRLTDERDEATKAARADHQAVGANEREAREIQRLLITRDKELADLSQKREKAQIALENAKAALALAATAGP